MKPTATTCRYCQIESKGCRLTDSTPHDVFWDGIVPLLRRAMKIPLEQAILEEAEGGTSLALFLASTLGP